MTNFEKYKTEILNYIENHGEVPARVNGEFVSCSSQKCKECKYEDKVGDCVINFIKWLYKDDGVRGCRFCKHGDKESTSHLCSGCCRNPYYTDKFEPKPKKTRRDEFLEHYPNANVLGIQPCSIDKEYFGEYCSKYDWCSECVDDYWPQEVDE